MSKFTLPLEIVCLLFLATHTYAQWVQTNSPKLIRVNAFELCDSILFAGTESGVFRSTDKGLSWSSTGFTNRWVYDLAVNGNNLFAATAFFGAGGVFLSADSGLSWNAVNTGLTDMNVLSLCVSDSFLLAGTNNTGVFLSTDTGAFWSAINTGWLDSNAVYSLSVSGGNFLAGANFGLFLSTNKGASWTKTGPFYSVSAFAAIGNNLFAGGDGVGLSTDNGISWTAVNNGLTNTWVFALASSGINLFAGTNIVGGGGVFVTTDSGKHWSNVSTGLPNADVHALMVYDDMLFAGTDGNGIWRRPLSEMASSIRFKKNGYQYKTKLHISNPYSGVKFTYSIQSRCFVQFGIYAISGEKVILLKEGIKTAGEYSVAFEAGKMPSGIYICNFQAGDYQESSLFMVRK